VQILTYRPIGDAFYADRRTFAYNRTAAQRVVPAVFNAIDRESQRDILSGLIPERIPKVCGYIKRDCHGIRRKLFHSGNGKTMKGWSH
jgi:hypothetical protein